MLCLHLLLFALAVRAQVELERIASVPRINDCAEKYFQEISKDLLIQAPLLFTSRAQQVVSAFEQKYQVLVSLRSPFQSYDLGEKCFRIEANEVPWQIDTSFTTLTFDTAGLPPVPISSYSIAARADEFEGDFHMNGYLYNALYEESVIIFEKCLAEPSMNVIFSDSASLEMDHDSCPGFSTGATYKPDSPLARVFSGKNLNDVFTAEVGANYLFSGGILQSFALILCAKLKDPFGFDQARSVINFPAFRFDSDTGKYYYTVVVRNAVSEMLYLTIIKEASTMTCFKK